VNATVQPAEPVDCWDAPYRHDLPPADPCRVNEAVRVGNNGGRCYITKNSYRSVSGCECVSVELRYALLVFTTVIAVSRHQEDLLGANTRQVNAAEERRHVRW